MDSIFLYLVTIAPRLPQRQQLGNSVFRFLPR
jgi:hypothetical protein